MSSPADEVTFTDVYPVEVGSQPIELPIVAIDDDLAIALLITVDVPLSFIDRAGEELADKLQPHGPEVVVTAATLGIPVALATARALGHDTIVVLHKTPKTHLADALVEPLSSITTRGEQVFRLDRARTPELDGRAVAFVDDVVSTGGSAAAAVRLIEAAGGRVCASGALLVEGTGWRKTLGQHADTLESLGSIPIFRPADGGAWSAVFE
ncbi:MAG: phosphoribosyltransferase family protein [Actinomycetota bacterium]